MADDNIVKTEPEKPSVENLGHAWVLHGRIVFLESIEELELSAERLPITVSQVMYLRVE